MKEEIEKKQNPGNFSSFYYFYGEQASTPLLPIAFALMSDLKKIIGSVVSESRMRNQWRMLE